MMRIYALVKAGIVVSIVRAGEDPPGDYDEAVDISTINVCPGVGDTYVDGVFVADSRGDVSGVVTGEAPV